MGWTSYRADNYKNGTVDRKAECDAYWESGLNKGHFKVERSCMRGSIYYAAIRALVKRNGSKDGKDIYEPLQRDDQYVFGVVFLTSVNMKDYYNFSYKEMDETCGPGYYDCPISILNLLTPTDDEYAFEWRKKCMEENRKKKCPNNLNNLPIGSRIRFILPFNCSAGNVGDEIICKKEKWNYRAKTFWYGAGYRWNPKMIPANYEVLSRG